MIVDCHCHAGTGDGLTGPWDTAGRLGGYLRRARAAGIDRTVVFSVFHSDYAEANREVAGLVAGHPDRLLGFAFVHAQRDAGRIQALVTEAVEVHRFCGIKVHRHDAPITREICETARGFGLPVLYDVGGEIPQIELIASQYPDISFIIPHLGSFVDRWDHQLALIDHLERHDNVYADTSGVRRFGLLAEAIRRAGPHKVLFGSDGPWFHPGVELAKIHALGLPPAGEALVLGGNLLRLVGASHHARQPPHAMPLHRQRVRPR